MTQKILCSVSFAAGMNLKKAWGGKALKTLRGTSVHNGHSSPRTFAVTLVGVIRLVNNRQLMVTLINRDTANVLLQRSSIIIADFQVYYSWHLVCIVHRASCHLGKTKCKPLLQTDYYIQILGPKVEQITV